MKIRMLNRNKSRGENEKCLEVHFGNMPSRSKSPRRPTECLFCDMREHQKIRCNVLAGFVDLCMSGSWREMGSAHDEMHVLSPHSRAATMTQLQGTRCGSKA
jgi:hypothetical protein